MGGKKKVHVKRVEETRLCKCELTQEELLKYGEEQADAQTRLLDLESELKQYKEEHKGRVANAEGTIHRCMSLIRSKYQHRDTVCERVFDYDNGTITVTKKDTGEVVEEREMNKDEQQMGLDIEEEKTNGKTDVEAGGGDVPDEFIKEAMHLIHASQRASTSGLQRGLKIGYTRAARIMDVLEEKGFIGPPRGSEPREILVEAPE